MPIDIASTCPPMRERRRVQCGNACKVVPPNSSSIQTVTVGTVVATVRAAAKHSASHRRLADYTADREFHPALKSLLGAKLQQIIGIAKRPGAHAASRRVDKNNVR